MEELKELQGRLRKELENYIVKDTYTKGKNAGIRKAIVMIEDYLGELCKEDKLDNRSGDCRRASRSHRHQKSTDSRANSSVRGA